MNIGNVNRNIWFQNRLNEIYGNDEYLLIDDYINTNTKITLKHLKCNSIFTKSPMQLIQGHGCPNCSSRKKFNNEIFDKWLGTEYTRLSDCKTVNDSVLIQHNCEKCNNYQYNVKPNNFRMGKRCPKCSGVLKKTKEDIQEYLDKLYPNEYEVIGEYKNKDTPIEIFHKTCNNKIYITWTNIREKRFSCKYCKMSSGELEVSLILKELGINYDYQYIIDDCKDKKVLPFDFHFIKDNKEFIIEYDGRQHFMEIFGEDVNDKKYVFETTIKHDKIKNKYCKENNINLLRIKYNETNIKNLIENFIS